jgi:predicted DNA-binding mobile mystery protein A
MIDSNKKLKRMQLSDALQAYPSPETAMPPRGGWVRAIREALGMTQAQLGARAGISRQSVQDFERAEADRRITLDSLDRLARAMGCRVAYALVPEGGTLDDLRERRADALAEAYAAADREKGLLSKEHFSVDGTLIQAWASQKSFRPKDGSNDQTPSGGGRNAQADWKGRPRSNDTHASTTDPDARLYRKSNNTASILCYQGHALMENRHGLVVGAVVTHADGTGERAGRPFHARYGAGQPCQNGGGGQGLRYGRLHCRLSQAQGHAARRAERGPARRQRHRRTHDPVDNPLFVGDRGGGCASFHDAFLRW